MISAAEGFIRLLNKRYFQALGLWCVPRMKSAAAFRAVSSALMVRGEAWGSSLGDGIGGELGW